MSRVDDSMPGKEALSRDRLPKFLYAGHFDSLRPVGWHRHPGTELILITRGLCLLQEQGGAWQTGRRGDLFVVPPHVAHRQRNVKPSTTTYVVFEAMRNLPHDKVPKLTLRPGDPLWRWIEDIHEIGKAGALRWSDAHSGLLLACLARVVSLVEQGQRRAELHPALARACDHAREHFVDALTPALLARHAGVSVSHLNGLFRRQLGHSPMQHVEMLRIERACQLLRSPYTRVSETAPACGFADPNYFVRVFKRRMGYSPARWRKRGGATVPS